MNTHQESPTAPGWSTHGDPLESRSPAGIVPGRGCARIASRSTLVIANAPDAAVRCGWSATQPRSFRAAAIARRLHAAIADPAHAFFARFGLILMALLFTGCAGPVAPIGADKVTTRRAYAQVEANALSTGQPSSDTVSILHRFDLDGLAARQPDEAVRQLHQKALATGERNVLFALAEMSYVAGERVRRSVKPWDPRDARDFYLGSAVYAWLFLFGEGEDAPPSAFDRRFRTACDLYNYGLGLALTERRSTNAVVRLEKGRRRLPVGEIELELGPTHFPAPLEFDQIVLADQFRVRGLSVRNRVPGVGAPLICVSPLNPELNMRPSIPLTAFLRGPGSLGEVATNGPVCRLELYPVSDGAKVTIGNAQVPLEIDLTAYRAYTLN